LINAIRGLGKSGRSGREEDEGHADTNGDRRAHWTGLGYMFMRKARQRKVKFERGVVQHGSGSE
jgi:hypothetical protein